MRSSLATAAVAVVLLLGLAAPAQATAKAPVYKNCTAMHKKYKGGIAKKGAKDKRPGGGHAKYKPYVNTSFYNANKKSDRDKDGIACEQ
ncbi:MAG: excalibur calcium-binding domain-containing protein [Jatrophihabitans sp.]